MRRTALFALVLAFLAASCGGGGTEAGGRRNDDKPCREKLPFQAGYLPSGFSSQLRSGPVSGRPTIENVAIFHYSGSGGKSIEIFRGGLRHKLGRTTGLLVLKRLARIGDFPGGYGVRWRMRSARCGLYQLEATGLPSAEVVKVVQGLKARS